MDKAKEPLSGVTIILPEGETCPAQIEWKAHPTFPGVWMKHLILGKDSGGKLSCHLVRVEKGREIGLHDHTGAVELHEVLFGRGICRMEEVDMAYAPGVCAVIPEGVVHSVAAIGGELVLMARFAPALM